MKRRITVVGSSNVDFIMQLERLPVPGETVTNGVFLQVCGGKGANQVVAAARAGGETTFLACLGEDSFAETMLANFRQDGIETEYIVRTASVVTGTALILVDRNGENSIAVAPGANYALLPAHIEACAETLQQSALLLLQMELSAPTIQCVLDIAEAHSIPVLFNYAPVKAQEIALSTQIDTLVVNEGEAESLSGLTVETIEQAITVAEALQSRGPKIVIITLGVEGSVVASPDFRGHVPAFVVEPLDTTAAGDVFCGALAVAIVEQKPIQHAVQFASAASALSVTRLGAQPSIPYRSEIETFLQERGHSV